MPSSRALQRLPHANPSPASDGGFGAPLAASILVGATAGVLATRDGSRPQIELVAGAMMARGPLAQALDTQLAATQDAATPVYLNLSYRNRAGAYCRVFNTRSEPGLSGVACRRGKDWQLPKC